MTAELVRRYGPRLLYVASFGSVARGEETPLSDIDLYGVVGKGASRVYSWPYGTTPVDVVVMPRQEVRRRLLQVDRRWPHRVGKFFVHQSLHDAASMAEQLRRAQAPALTRVETYRIPREPGFYEYFSKAHRAWEARNPEPLRYATWELFFMSCMDLALLNKRFYVNHTTMIRQIEDFPRVPDGFLRHARQIFDPSLDQVYEGAQGLFEIHRQLAAEHGYAMEALADVGEIRLRDRSSP